MSSATWRPEKGAAEVFEQRGKLLMRMGAAKRLRCCWLQLLAHACTEGKGCMPDRLHPGREDPHPHGGGPVRPPLMHASCAISRSPCMTSTAAVQVPDRAEAAEAVRRQRKKRADPAAGLRAHGETAGAALMMKFPYMSNVLNSALACPAADQRREQGPVSAVLPPDGGGHDCAAVRCCMHCPSQSFLPPWAPSPVNLADLPSTAPGRHPAMWHVATNVHPSSIWGAGAWAAACPRPAGSAAAPDEGDAVQLRAEPARIQALLRPSSHAPAAQVWTTASYKSANVSVLQRQRSVQRCCCCQEASKGEDSGALPNGREAKRQKLEETQEGGHQRSWWPVLTEADAAGDEPAPSRCVACSAKFHEGASIDMHQLPTCCLHQCMQGGRGREGAGEQHSRPAAPQALPRHACRRWCNRRRKHCEGRNPSCCCLAGGCCA